VPHADVRLYEDDGLPNEDMICGHEIGDDLRIRGNRGDGIGSRGRSAGQYRESSH